MLFSAVLTYIGYTLPLVAYGEQVLIKTKYGHVLGQRRRESYDFGEAAVTNTVDVFLGVPYAEAPVGAYRYQPPQPPEPWRGMLNNTSAKWTCPQRHYYTQTRTHLQREDCLYLNIYAPYEKAASLPPYPVMMFIHGGSYEEGAGNRYDGMSLAMHGIVVVTINYRLGELGYLTTGTDELPGNYGLMDQIQALKWVSENIISFRGDKSRVTIAGNSAGAASVGLMMLAPPAKGLFNGAILQSGSPLSFWATYNQTAKLKDFVMAVSHVLDCRSLSIERSIQCLNGIDYRAIIEKHWKFPRIVPSGLNFKPHVDGHLIPDRPLRMFMKGDFHKVPVLTGVVHDEWARSMGWFVRDLNTSDLDKIYFDGLNRDSFEKYIRHVITERFGWPKAIAHVLSSAYTDWTNIKDPLVNRENYKEFMSDFSMVAPTVHLATLVAKHKYPVYMYLFDHESPHTWPRWWKCYHSLELDYVFGSPFNGYDIATDRRQNFTDADRNISRYVMKLWSNFVKFGTPNAGTPTKDKPTWDRLEPAKLNYLYIHTNVTEMRRDFKVERMALWNRLIPKLVKELIGPRKALRKQKPDIIQYMFLSYTFITLTFILTLTIIIMACRFQCMMKR